MFHRLDAKANPRCPKRKNIDLNHKSNNLSQSPPSLRFGMTGLIGAPLAEHLHALPACATVATTLKILCVNLFGCF